LDGQYKSKKRSIMTVIITMIFNIALALSFIAGLIFGIADPFLGEYFQWHAERIDEQMKENPRHNI
jgi:hypothetical protein